MGDDYRRALRSSWPTLNAAKDVTEPGRKCAPLLALLMSDARAAQCRLTASGLRREGVSGRFWFGFFAVFVVMTHSGYYGGFTSPVLSTNCGGGGVDGGSGSGSADDAGLPGSPPCPECLNCEMRMSLQLQSIFTSEQNFINIPAALLGGALVDAVGRKAALILGSLGVIASWLIMRFAPAAAHDDGGSAALLAAAATPSAALWTPGMLMLLGGRALGAVASCIQVIAGSVWVAESCPAWSRGGVLTAISFGWNIGTLGVYGLGSVQLSIAWRGLSVGGAVLGGVMLCTSKSLDTPAYP